MCFDREKKQLLYKSKLTCCFFHTPLLKFIKSTDMLTDIQVYHVC